MEINIRIEVEKGDVLVEGEVEYLNDVDEWGVGERKQISGSNVARKGQRRKPAEYIRSMWNMIQQEHGEN